MHFIFHLFAQVGLVGEKKKFHLDKKSAKWKSVMLPTNRPFTWYKVTLNIQNKIQASIQTNSEN